LNNFLNCFKHSQRHAPPSNLLMPRISLSGVTERIFAMRKLLAASALLMGLSAATPSMAAIDYPWCVGEVNQASLQCRFTSYEQCQGTAVGTGECYRNPFYVQGSDTQSSPPPSASTQQDVPNNGRQKRRTN
jgi:hypothetical protein